MKLKLTMRFCTDHMVLVLILDTINWLELSLTKVDHQMVVIMLDGSTNQEMIGYSMMMIL